MLMLGVLMLAEQRGPAVTMKPWAVDRRSATLRTSIRPRAANEMRGKLVPNLRNVEPCNVARLTLRALLNYGTFNVQCGKAHVASLAKLRNVERCNVARLTLRALLNYGTLNIAMWQGSHCVI